MKKWMFGFGLVLFACGHSSAATSPRAAHAAISPPIAHPRATWPVSSSGAAADLAYGAIACWLGPVWGEALGEPEDERVAKAHERCAGVAREVWGSASGEEQRHVERLRALDEVAIEELVARVDELATGQPAHHQLVALLGAQAAAQRENMRARRAADAVKKDLTGERKHHPITDDERAAVEPLRQVDAIAALFNFHGPLGSDAHALGVLSAMDRLSFAGGLPRHLEIYADEPAFALLFGAVAPPTPSDPTVSVLPRVWIAELTAAAEAAGHPVPRAAKRPAERDQLAWSGVLDGVADQLTAHIAEVSPRLRPVAEGTGQRLRARASDIRETIAQQRSSRHRPQLYVQSPVEHSARGAQAR